MGISRSSCYAVHTSSPDDTEIVEAIVKICDEFECYGWRGVQAELRHRGMIVNHNKIRRLMREHDLQPRRRRRYVLDAEPSQSPAHLRQLFAIDRPGHGRVEIVRAAIGIEAHRQPMGRKHFSQRPKGRGRALFLDQKRRVNLARRVIQRRNQIQRRMSRKPSVPRAVLVQHHPRQRTPLPPAPMRSLARSLPHDALPLQMQLQPRAAPAKAVIPDQMLVEVLDREALVTLAIKPLHFLRPIRRNSTSGRLTKPSIGMPGLAFLLVSARPPPKRPRRYPKKLRRLLLIELRRFPSVQEIQKHRHARTLSGFRPAHPNPHKWGARYRTDRALPNPDISSATDSQGHGSISERTGKGYTSDPLSRCDSHNAVNGTLDEAPSKS